ncbi:unnamed protein product, partial [marine sediment metagenome]
MKILTLFANHIDRVNRWTGKVVCWLILPLMLSLCYEVIARYAFNAPTLWAYDTTYILYGSLFMLGAGYTLLVDQHVRIEAIYSAIPPKMGTIFEIIGYLIFFFPAIGALLYFGIDFAKESWIVTEQAKSLFAIPIYPFKTVLPVAAFLLLIQGIAKFAGCLVSLI